MAYLYSQSGRFRLRDGDHRTVLFDVQYTKTPSHFQYRALRSQSEDDLGWADEEAEVYGLRVSNVSRRGFEIEYLDFDAIEFEWEARGVIDRPLAGAQPLDGKLAPPPDPDLPMSQQDRPSRGWQNSIWTKLTTLIGFIASLITIFQLFGRG